MGLRESDLLARAAEIHGSVVGMQKGGIMAAVDVDVVLDMISFSLRWMSISSWEDTIWSNTGPGPPTR